MAKREVKAPVSTLDMAPELWVLLAVLLEVVGVDELAAFDVATIDNVVVAAALVPDTEELVEIGAALIWDRTVELNVPVIPLRVNLAEKLM